MECIERIRALREDSDLNQTTVAKAKGFVDAIPEQATAYKIRTKKAPTKTIKVYKVFTLADDGSPTALFVSGTSL